MPYTVVDFEQGSAEWHAWRSGRYTASQAPAVMGASPFFPRTPRELYRLRTGQAEVSVNAAMRRGTELEPRARELLQESFPGLEPLCAEAEVSGLALGASLDGVATTGKGKKARRVGVEIKTPAAGSSSELWGGKAGEHYRWQMAHQLLVVDDLEELHLAAYAHDVDQVRVVDTLTRADLARDYAAPLLEAWAAFDASMAEFREPAAIDADVLEVTDDADELVQLGFQYAAVQAQISQLEAIAKGIRETIERDAEARGGGCKVATPSLLIYRQERAGNVNWKAKPIAEALAAAGVNPDDYRAKPSRFWTLKLRGEG